jgi:hypothetical protein
MWPRHRRTLKRVACAQPSPTPNPNAMKFTLDLTLPERIDTARGQGDDTPFVHAVLAVNGVRSVFGVNDFVTVMRDPDADWDPIVCAVQDAAEAHLHNESGQQSDEDPVAHARDLLRDAVTGQPPTPVEIRRASPSEPDTRT